ncbi:hypothetical protein [Pseudalkalibacillus berkeleyi]|uniref:Uncharacterized protein n=1 Tax=Pseudalkalibacillus berkeleyi TaxID=1069813 RepID=A0ABS9H3V6_9BACL|nr:hypothetical protein [Pseudalkalibacillus berkeleyi]MCF6139633.1 hypothetical protein [Pseudalkalibacillus berkeleyi]
MKTFTIALALILSFGFIFSPEIVTESKAAQGSNDKTEYMHTQEDTENKIQTEQPNTQTNTTVSRQVKDNNEMSKTEEQMNYIRERISIAQTKSEVEAIMGTEYREHLNAMEGTTMWTYDLLTAKGYQFTGEMDEVDIQGLLNGDVNIALSINWNEQTGKSDFVSVHYTNGKENTLCNYRIFEDGSSKDSCYQY